MDWKRLILISVLFALPGVPAQAQQADSPQGQAASEPERANDQRFVVGAGIGSHAFADPLRVETESGDLEIKSALMSQVWGEWYVLDTVGFGVRLISFGADSSATASVTVNDTTSTVKSEIGVDVSNWLVTAHWIPFGGQSYFRIGVLGGLGVCTMEVTDKTTPGDSNSDSTSGPAQLLGAYIDWGGEAFGARFGAQYLATQLDDVNGQSVNASGRELYLDLRWAF